MKKEEVYKDPIITKLFAEGGEVKPPTQFASRILKNIKIESNPRSLVYTPLISKKTWLILTFAGIAMFLTVFFTSKTQSTTDTDLLGKFFQPDFTYLRHMMEKIMVSFEFGPVMQTSLLAMAVFIIIQLVILEWRNRSIFK